MSTREYIVKSTYETVDRSTRVLHDIGSAANRTSREVSALHGSLRGLGAFWIAGTLFSGGKKALIDFNSSIQDTKQQIAGMLALATKTTLNDNLERSSQLYDDLAKKAAKLPGTTQEYVEMAGMITQPIVDAGLRMKDLEDITVNSVVAAKALRVEAGAAARDVDQALRGQYHSVDVFTGKLLGSMGYTGEAGRKKFNQLDVAHRASELKKAITQTQITELAAAQGATFSGVLSTTQDTTQRMLAKVGQPLFQYLTKELANINVWLDKNEDVLNRWAKTVGEDLVSGFKTVKSLVGFVADHAGTFIKMGEVWGAVKIAGMLGGSGGGGMNNIASMAGGLKEFFRKGGDRFNPETGAYELVAGGRGQQKVGMGNIGGNLGLLAQTATLGYAFGTLINRTTGLSDAMAGAQTVNGEVLDVRDDTTRKYADLITSMDAFDASLRKATKDLDGKTGAGGTSAGLNLGAAGTVFGTQSAIIHDYLREKQFRDRSDWFRKAGVAAGMNIEDINAIIGGDTRMVGAIDRKVNDLKVRNAAAISLTDNQVAVGMANLPKAIREQTDVTKVNQRIMEMELGYFQQFGMWKVFDPKEFAKVVDEINKGDKLKNQTNFNQNVTVHINQVTTKDPQRWLVDLNDVVQKRARSPVSPQRGWGSKSNK